MASFLDQVGNVARDAVQGLACGVENYQEFIRRVSPLGDIVPPPPSLWPLLCPDRPPPPEVFPRPPFQGGQCEGVVYLISYAYDEITTFSPRQTVTPPQSPRAAIGPFRGFRYEQPKVIQGEEVFGRIVALTGAGPTTWHQAASNTGFFVANVTGITRQDGQPDDCGSPPPGFPIPPTPFPPLPPEDRPVTDPDGGPDIDFTFAPTLAPVFIDIDGSVNVPVNVNVSGPNIFAPVDIPVTINLPTFAPSFNFGGGQVGEPGPPTSPCCEPPTVPGEPVDGVEDEPVQTEPPPEGLRMYGVQVVSEVNTERTDATEIGTGPDIPSLWVPRIGSVYFELDVSQTRGEVRLLYSQDYDVKLSNQLVIGPTEGRIRRAFIRPAKGVRATAIPLFTAARN